MAKYELEMQSIDKQRKEITQKAKTEAQNLLSEANAKIENTIRQIKEAEAEKDKTKVARKELEEFKAKIEETTLKSRSTELTPKPKGDLKSGSPKLQLNKKSSNKQAKPDTRNSELETFSVGSNVRLKGQTATGQIIEIQDKQAIVAFGQMKSTLKLTKLEIISNTQLKKENRKYENLGNSTTDEVRQRKLTFQSEIDVRGMRVDEALQAVMYFIDDAVMVGIASVRILHGTGTGALRQMIRQYLGTVHGVKTYRDEHIQFGGAGITVIEFE